MSRRRNFRPSCAEVETLENRKLMDAGPPIPAPMPPVAFAPTDPIGPMPYPSGTPLAPIAPGIPVANGNTLPQDVLTYSIPVIGLGDPGSAGLLTVNLKIVDANTGAVLFQQTQLIPVDGGTMQTINVPVDLSALQSGVYDFTMSAQDGSAQVPTEMTSTPSLIEVTAPVTSNPFTVASGDYTPIAIML